MNELQVFASELGKFSWEDDSREVLVAGKGIVGVAIMPTESINPADLVGGSDEEAATVKVKVNSKWKFRAERPLVESGNGGSFAFLIPMV